MKISFSTVNFYGTPVKPLSGKMLQHKPSVIIPQKGALDECSLKLLTDIRELFEFAHSSIKSAAKSCNTRNAIKNGYENLNKGIAGSRILEFANIGENGENISVNMRTDHGKTKKAVIIIDNTPLVINKKGEIEKNPTMRFIGEKTVRPKGKTIEYYTQKEIDELGVFSQFFALKKELQKYISYISARTDKINKIREIKKESLPGSTKKYNDLINELTDEFVYFKTHINKLSESSLDKSVFRISNKVKTFHASPSIMLKNATPDGRSIYLLNSKLKHKKSIKLFVMDYNNKNIDKSFITYDNKLVKYFPKIINERPKHNDFHYLTQEEIDNSGYEYYLNLAIQRLTEVNNNLRREIEYRLSR